MSLVRRATEADADTIAELTRLAYGKWVAVLGREPLPMRVDYHDAVRRHRFDLLYEGDSLAALIETTPDGDCLLIVNVAVHPAMQGRGFGRRLLSLAEEIAAEGGFPALRLYTNALMVENIALYEQLGYRRDREELRDVGTVLYMRKPLTV